MSLLNMMKYLMLRCEEHWFVIKTGVTGTIPSICLMADVKDGSEYLFDSSDDLPRNQSDNTPLGHDSMLARSDCLCELLGDSLHEIVIIPTDSHLTRKTMHAIHNEMPNMARRKSLVFRDIRDDPEEDLEPLDTGGVIRHMFARNSPYFEEVTLEEVAPDDQQSEPPEAQLYASIRLSEVSGTGYSALYTLETDDDLL